MKSTCTSKPNLNFSAPEVAKLPSNPTKTKPKLAQALIHLPKHHSTSTDSRRETITAVIFNTPPAVLP
jgi:hypothetical protein